MNHIKASLASDARASVDLPLFDGPRMQSLSPSSGSSMRSHISIDDQEMLAADHPAQAPTKCIPLGEVEWFTAGPAQHSQDAQSTLTDWRSISKSSMLPDWLNRMQGKLLKFDGAVESDPFIESWLESQPGELGKSARRWFEVMRSCGDEVRELLHDGCPTACLGDAPFGYVNVFTSHVNVGFFRGANLPDPARLLQGNGKLMRHTKLKLGTKVNESALTQLIDAAYADIKMRVEND